MIVARMYGSEIDSIEAGSGISVGLRTSTTSPLLISVTS